MAAAVVVVAAAAAVAVVVVAAVAVDAVEGAQLKQASPASAELISGMPVARISRSPSSGARFARTVGSRQKLT
jgi:hypothetical protein